MKPRTIRLNAETETRLTRVREAEGGISEQAALMMLLARGFRVWEAEQDRAPNATNAAGGKY